MDDTTQRDITNVLDQLFPNGAGHINYHRAKWALNKIAQIAFTAGRNYSLMGLMTAQDVADHFKISHARARALIQNRHERFGIGMKFGSSWLIHRDELPDLEPDEKYRRNNG